MKIAFAVFLSLVVIFVGWNVIGFLRQEHDLNANLKDVEARLAAAKIQEANLQAQTEYLSNPANLEKELRAEFNYTKPGEKMIIIVPAQTASGTGQ